MKMKTFAIIGVTGTIVLAIVIAVAAHAPDTKPKTSPQKSIVLLNVGQKSSVGILELTQDDPEGPVTIKGNVTGLTAGKHGFHVHVKGDISNGCASTGGHFNPNSKLHGSPDVADRHVGDLGNIEANSAGEAVVDIVDKQLSLYPGPNSIIGRAFVVHAGEDDLGQGGDAGSTTTGNAGGRFACGIIALA